MRALGLIVLVLLAGVGIAAPAADSDQPGRLAEGKIHYMPPEGWAENRRGGKFDTVLYLAPDKNAVLSVEAPPDMDDISPAAGGKLIVKLREMRKAKGQKSTLGPRVEADNRFDLKIHEKYEFKGKVFDQVHLYRRVGPRIVMVTANALDEGDRVQKVHEVAEAVALSAATKGQQPKAPTSRPAPK